MRLDPLSLPVRFTVPMAGRPPEAAASVYLDRDQAVVCRQGAVGPTLISLPLKAFRGVAVRVEVSPSGSAITVVLEINHENPILSVPLATAEDPADIAADWQMWARVLNLPLLLVEPDGSVSEPMKRNGLVSGEPAKPRRRHSYFAARRPRFLTRRKTGRPGVPVVLQAAEIIARD